MIYRNSNKNEYICFRTARHKNQKTKKENTGKKLI